MLGTGQQRPARMGAALAGAAALLSPLLLCSGECGRLRCPRGWEQGHSTRADVSVRLVGVQAFGTQRCMEATGTLPAGFERTDPAFVGVVISHLPRLLGRLFRSSRTCCDVYFTVPMLISQFPGLFHGSRAYFTVPALAVMVISQIPQFVEMVISQILYML